MSDIENETRYDSLQVAVVGALGSLTVLLSQLFYYLCYTPSVRIEMQPFQGRTLSPTTFVSPRSTLHGDGLLPDTRVTTSVYQVRVLATASGRNGLWWTEAGRDTG